MINFSVGAGSRNLPEDVVNVQSLLNNAPGRSGGPIRPLAVDGLSGRKTRAAIARFQQLQFGWHDSVVDPDGPTIHRLETFTGGHSAPPPTAPRSTAPSSTAPTPPPAPAPAPPTPPRTPPPSTARIVWQTGTVETRRPSSGDWQPAPAGTVIQPGSRVVTRGNGHALLRFDSDGSTIEMRPDTLVIIYKPRDTARRTTSRAVLETGRLREALESLQGN